MKCELLRLCCLSVDILIGRAQITPWTSTRQFHGNMHEQFRVLEWGKSSFVDIHYYSIEKSVITWYCVALLISNYVQREHFHQRWGGITQYLQTVFHSCRDLVKTFGCRFLVYLCLEKYSFTLSLLQWFQ